MRHSFMIQYSPSYKTFGVILYVGCISHSLAFEFSAFRRHQIFGLQENVKRP